MLESPRKFNMSMKDSQSIRDDVSRAHASSINLKCDCSNNSFWPSQESRGMDSFIGCDSSSLVDDLESSDEMSHFSRYDNIIQLNVLFFINYTILFYSEKDQ